MEITKMRSYWPKKEELINVGERIAVNSTSLSDPGSSYLGCPSSPREFEFLKDLAARQERGREGWIDSTWGFLSRPSRGIHHFHPLFIARTQSYGPSVQLSI